MEKDAVLQLIEEAARNKNTVLDLSGNQLTSLPPEIGQLKNLTQLILPQNQLTSLPSEIVQLINLTKLDLSGNQLTSLPPEIVQLINLTGLYIFRNQLTSLPPEIRQLINLTELNIWGNQLTSLPPEIGQLINLTELVLSGNQLTSLPPEIGQLKNLTGLYIFDNQLTSLPPEIGQLTNLTTLILSGNPLKSPPPEIVEQGIEAIFEYLRLPPEKEHNEAKLILVGQGDVGKTCLAKRLIYNKFIKDKTTEGIDIFKWSINAPTPEKEEIKLNVWDFGGQEIYHATHQFFLTKRSVYLLVWNARKSRDFEHIYYWLHTIEAFGEDSPIILVMCKLHERDDDLNMKDLREKFPQIVGLYKVDNEDGVGIPELNNIISQTTWNLPQMQTPWAESWFKVRERLEQDGRDWIDYKEYRQICKSEGLDKKQTDILDEYLHFLGVIIHYRDRLELCDMVILRPEWATDAFYKVLDTHSVLENGGMLLHNNLEQIWDTDIYPQDIFHKLLGLMNKFELVYELPDKRSHLVAELLPSTEPDFNWDNSDNLQFYYSYDFLPAGVMTRFIVRVHEDLEKKSDGTHLCWREGAVLSHKETSAYVRVKPSDKLIEIKINGTRKRELLAIIRYHFDHINSAIRKVKITKEVPCNCSDNCLHRFDYEGLLIAENKGKSTVECPKSWEKVPLSLLLDGYARKEIRMKESNEILKEKGMLKVEFSPHIVVKPEISPHIAVKSDIKVETYIDIDLKLDLPTIQSDFRKFKREVAKLDEDLKEELEDLEDDFLEITPTSEQGKINKALNKLSTFMQELDDEDSKFYKVVKGSKKGIESGQKLGKTYNKFAQWLALPQVPDLFLG